MKKDKRRPRTALQAVVEAPAPGVPAPLPPPPGMDRVVHATPEVSRGRSAVAGQVRRAAARAAAPASLPTRPTQTYSLPPSPEPATDPAPRPVADNWAPGGKLPKLEPGTVVPRALLAAPVPLDRQPIRTLPGGLRVVIDPETGALLRDERGLDRTGPNAPESIPDTVLRRLVRGIERIRDGR